MSWPCAQEMLTDLCAAKVQEETVTAEYPASRRLGHFRQLILPDPSLKNGDGVQETHGRCHGAPRAEDDQPGLKPAFGVLYRVFIVDHFDFNI